jgi:hypothetical protein
LVRHFVFNDNAFLGGKGDASWMIAFGVVPMLPFFAFLSPDETGK